MSIELGPILSFRGSNASEWTLSVLVVSDTETAPRLVWSVASITETIDATKLHDHLGSAVWRYDITVPRTSRTRRITYSVGGKDYKVSVPGRASPLRISYASCNGFSSAKTAKSVDNRMALWEQMCSVHKGDNYHLMLMGGDQVYADEIWAEPKFRKWSDLPLKQRQDAPFTSQMKREAQSFFFNLYTERWRAPGMADMFAQVPTLMMWDDHDIFDGWGSYTKDLQRCKVYNGIFNIARRHFAVFQQQISPSSRNRPGALVPSDNFTFVHEIDNTAIIGLDMRSERTWDTVVGIKTWNKIYEWLDQLPTNEDGTGSVKHLLLMTSIPVVHPSFRHLETALRFLPGQQDLEDDLKDHWHSVSHKEERLRLIHKLLEFANKRKIRVSLISGDVHVGAVGVIRSQRKGHEESRVINQLTSSGIVHTPPPGIVMFGLEMLAKRIETVDEGIEAELVEFTGLDQHFIGQRNWLSLELDETDRIWCHWRVENGDKPLPKVIHPIG